MYNPLPLTVRFWNNVDKSGDCWNWTAAKQGNQKYGQCRGPDGRMTGAHRVSYWLEHGEIPEGMVVCHRCDNGLCVNPEHLFLGTPKDNTRDSIQKGRQARGANLNHSPQVGSLNHGAKLNETIVAQIKQLHRDGLRQSQISRITGVPRPNVWCILHNKSWTHVE
jgi:hypothetical protein